MRKIILIGAYCGVGKSALLERLAMQADVILIAGQEHTLDDVKAKQIEEEIKTIELVQHEIPFTPTKVHPKHQKNNKYNRKHGK